MIIGCGAATPTVRHRPSSQAINWCGRWFVVDAGEGVQVGLRENRIPVQKIHCICISHMHGDHVFGLPGLIGSMNLFGRKEPLTIIGPASLKAFLWNSLRSTETHIRFELNFIVPDDQDANVVLEWGESSLTSIPVAHRIPAFGYAFEFKPSKRNLIKSNIALHQLSRSEILALKSGQNVTREDGSLLNYKELCLPLSPSLKYVYSGDTRPCERLEQAADQADLFYHEATFTHELAKRAKETGHSTAREAGQAATRAMSKMLIIGHISSRYKDESKLLNEAEEFHDNVQLAYDGMRIVLKPQ